MIYPRNWLWFPYYVNPATTNPMFARSFAHLTSTKVFVFFHAIHLIPSRDFPRSHPAMLVPSPKAFLWLPLISSVLSPHPVPAVYQKKLLYYSLPIELQCHPSLDFCIHPCYSCIINKVFLILPISCSTDYCPCHSFDSIK